MGEQCIGAHGVYVEVISNDCLARQRDIYIYSHIYIYIYRYIYVERGSSAVGCRTRNQVSPGSNPPLLPFRRLGIFVLSIDAPVDSAV